MQLLIATRNRHKLDEIQAILNSEDLEIIGLDDIPPIPETVEDGDSFEANAVKKATEAARSSGLTTLADDSGLEVDALDGAPGIHSARYAGEHGDDSANIVKLLKELGDAEDRTARFRCVIALATPEGEVRTVQGTCEGRIGFELCGENGFGYDPVFIPAGFSKTFAELSSAEKDSISHRGKALAAAKKAWWS